MIETAVLALTFKEAQEIINHNGYKIGKISYLNEPSEVMRVIRVKKVDAKILDILIAYH
ncbi:hypothetical protein SAMN00017405_0131 [Desulfonispora thiosulfatigenes DSM 11270]|uniref:Uncharacterized protein n=1 Tax=Desulfonispora thiosulfatigenes DSM 11270 TaxID=656914 RepID=A0A1W1VKU3_DESTI|nr:hypothetical protein [Desulfonispora thiosulfatigenes]SMB94005.1 hypothetical protein SAMN00017405_0131 [Desulfonispora thiosulfatigenes DSM 11270]